MTQRAILQVIPALETGGAEKTAIDIANALVERGDRAWIASEGGRLRSELDARVEHLDMPLASKNPITVWRNVGRLQQVISNESIDLVHARSRAPAWSALRAARRAKVPFVTTYHGAYSQKGAIKGLYNSVMARGDVVIANSSWTGALVAERHPFAKDKIIPIFRGTDFAHFSPSAISDERKAALRTRWGVTESQTTALLLGRLTNWKGHKTVIQAASMLAKEFPDLVFVFAGDEQGRAAYRGELEELIATLALEDRIRMPGHCDDPAAALGVCDIVLNASVEPEAFGRVAVEGAALEKCVIATDIGAAVETIQAPPQVSADRRTGWKVPPGDADALAGIIREILKMSKIERSAIGERSRSYAMEHFSLERMVRETFAVYDRLLADR